MKFTVYFSLFLFSFPSFFAMEKARHELADDAKQLAAEAESVEHDIEAKLDQGISQLHHLFAEFKKDSANHEKRLALSALQAQLLREYSSHFEQKPHLMGKLTQVFDAIKKEQEKIVGKIKTREERVVHAISSHTQVSPYSDYEIDQAMDAVRNARIKRANQYNRGAQIGVLATLGLGALAFYKSSREAAVGSAVCLSLGLYCTRKKYQLANSTVTRAQAIALLEKQKK